MRWVVAPCVLLLASQQALADVTLYYFTRDLYRIWGSGIDDIMREIDVQACTKSFVAASESAAWERCAAMQPDSFIFVSYSNWGIEGFAYNKLFGFDWPLTNVYDGSTFYRDGIKYNWDHPRYGTGKEVVITSHVGFKTCPDGHTLDLRTITCVGANHLVLQDFPQPAQCTANPIDAGSGIKLQREEDIAGPVPFGRFYHSTSTDSGIASGWRHSYQHALTLAAPVAPPALDGYLVSPAYASKQDACEQGWSTIQSQARAPWAGQAVAAYDSGTETCQLRAGGTVVATAAIYQREGVVALPQMARLSRADGTVVQFKQTSAGWSPVGTHRGQLESLGEGGWRYTAEDGSRETYAPDGRLLTIVRPDGAIRQLAYDPAGQLVGVTDGGGHGIGFEYLDGRMHALNGHGERQQFQYDSSDRLVRVLRADGTSRDYHYEDSRFPHALTGITDERGVRYATWAYDAQGRAISSAHADGADRHTLTYNADGSTTVTNPLGKQTTYRFATIHGVRKVTAVEGHPTASCAGANQSYSYTPEGWLASKTDWQGNLTTYNYDAQGREISRTEAAGTPAARTVATEWHPSLRLPVKITEPGQVTEISYDSNGRVLSRTVTPRP